MLSKTLRQEFEQVILASAILENKFPVVSKYLSDKNFTTDQNKTVFKVIASLFPLKPIDLLTVKEALEEVDKEENWAVHLGKMIGSLASSANLDYYCLVILENDVVNHFLQLLKKQSAVLESEVHKAAVSEVLEEFNNQDNKDQLHIMRESIVYLRSTSYPEEFLKELAAIEDQLASKVHKSKRLLYLEVLVRHLITFCEIQHDTKRRESIRRLSNMIVAIGFSTELPEDYFSKIETLAAEFV